MTSNHTAGSNISIKEHIPQFITQPFSPKTSSKFLWGMTKRKSRHTTRVWDKRDVCQRRGPLSMIKYTLCSTNASMVSAFICKTFHPLVLLINPEIRSPMSWQHYDKLIVVWFRYLPLINYCFWSESQYPARFRIDIKWKFQKREMNTIP